MFSLINGVYPDYCFDRPPVCLLHQPSMYRYRCERGRERDCGFKSTFLSYLRIRANTPHLKFSVNIEISHKNVKFIRIYF